MRLVISSPTKCGIGWAGQSSVRHWIANRRAWIRGKSGDERAAVQTLREISSCSAIAPASGLRWLQRRYPFAPTRHGEALRRRKSDAGEIAAAKRSKDRWNAAVLVPVY